MIGSFLLIFSNHWKIGYSNGMNLRIVFAALAMATCAQAQVNHPAAYDIGSPTLQDIWVDPVNGNDTRSGLSRPQAVRSVTEAWDRIPQNANLIGTGYRIMLVAGHHTDVPNYWEARFGVSARPVIIQSADGVGAARMDTMNIFNCRYLYLIGIRLETGGGDVLHIDSCDHVLVRNCQVVGTGDIYTYASPQEGFKGNQSQYVYVEGSDISGAFDNAVDFVGVQYGHFISNRVHRALDWCMYLKGGSAYFTVDGNEFFDGGTGGFTAGQGTGFEYMVNPWLHYEAYDIKFINNVVHHTGTVGLGVNGGYNILIAYNTLYKAGTNDHVFEVVHGSRSCDGLTLQCNANNAAGGWGGSGMDGQYIPSRNVYIFNNLVYNPAGSDSDWNQFVVNGATVPPAGSKVPSPSYADTNVRIRGNLIWNGSRIGINGGTGCGPGNPTCNDSQLVSDNTINTVEPQLVDPENGDYRAVVGGNVFQQTTYAVPSFDGGDRASPPTAPVGNLDNSVPADYLDVTRSGSGPPGAFAGPANLPPAVQLTSPVNGSYFTAPTNIVVSATATDSVDGVSLVAFYAGTTLIGADTNAPYSIVWSNAAPLLYALTARATDGLGVQGTSAVVFIRVLGTNTSLAPYDFDGDRVTDLGVFWPAAGNWYLMDSLDGALRQLSWGWEQVTPAPGDYDGDGLTDVAVYHAGAGNWYVLQSSNAAIRLVNWGWDAAVPVPGDYDGDGRTDIAVYAPASGDWYVLQSSNNLLRLQNWGWSDAIPVPADYDGDGTTDIAVYFPPTGDWYILQSTDTTLRHLNWGWYDAEPVPADYDGDGLADIAVYHQAAGIWYVLQSATTTLRTQGWGWSDAEPVPGDYDGDGRVDFAVYHQVAGNWYILQSGTGSLRQQNWGWSATQPVQNQFNLNRGKF